MRDILIYHFRYKMDERNHFYMIYCPYVVGLAEHTNVDLIFCSAILKNFGLAHAISQFLYAIMVWTCDRLLLWIQLIKKNPQSW